MMDHKTNKLVSAIGDMDTAYLEEALDYDGAKAGRKRIHRFPNYLPRVWRCWSYWACP